MRKFVISFFIVMALQHPCSAQIIGQTAPDVLFSTVLNKKGITPASLKNKYIVLDFWATWCGPCVASLPHFSKLSEEFSSDSVVFAIISSEEKNKVSNFLSNRPVQALYLIDSITKTSKENMRVNDLYGLTAQRFGVEGIPHTVVVDNYGLLRWVGHAAKLTPDTMKDILNGKFEKVQEEQARQKAEDKKNAALRKQLFEQLKKDTINGANYKVIVAKTPPYVSSDMSAGNGKNSGRQYVEFRGHKMNFLYFYFTRTSFVRIKNLLSDKESGYFMRFEMDTSFSNQEFMKTGLTALARASHVSFEKKEVSAEVWTLQIADQKKFIKNSKPLDAKDYRSSGEDDKERTFTNFTLAGMIPELEDDFKIFMELKKNDLNNKLADFKIPKGDIEFTSQKLFELYGVKMVKSIKKTAITEIRQNL